MRLKALNSAALFQDIRCESPCVFPAAQEWLRFERRARQPQEQETPAASFDHLVGLRLQTEWHPQGFRGFEIDDKLEFSRLRDGEVGRLSALEDLVDVVSRERIMGWPYRAVSDQPARAGEIGNPYIVGSRVCASNPNSRDLYTRAWGRRARRASPNPPA